MRHAEPSIAQGSGAGASVPVRQADALEGLVSVVERLDYRATPEAKGRERHPWALSSASPPSKASKAEGVNAANGAECPFVKTGKRGVVA